MTADYIGYLLHRTGCYVHLVRSYIHRPVAKAVANHRDENGAMISLSTAGTTRLVLVIGPWAVKFARGRRCNKYEANLFGTTNERRRAMLCPVRWCSRVGLTICRTR